MNRFELIGSNADHQLDESVWKSRRHRGRRKLERAAAVRVIAVKCCSIGALLAMVVFWRRAPQFGIVLKAMVTAGAAVVACQAASMRRRVFAAVFAIVVFLFNPFIPVFGLSGVWEFGVVVAAMAVFASSLALLPSPEIPTVL